MNTPLRSAPSVAVILVAAAHLGGPVHAAGQSSASAPAPTVELVATDYAFEVPDALRSGWTTLRFRNEGEEHHFVVLQRLPEGRTYDHYLTEVVEPFNQVWHPLRDGEIGPDELLPRLVEVLPEWFWSVRQMGGPGLTAPGGTSQVTVRLEPGDYVIECYVKTSDGEFHAFEGMLRPLTVTAEDTGGTPPAADLTLSVTNQGMELDGEVRAGRRTVAVRFVEHPEGGFPHDAHLARLPEGADVQRVVEWVNWVNVEGLMEPAPATFVGGSQEMPAGHVAYVTVDFEPGRYLWVSEATGSLGVMRAFTVR